MERTGPLANTGPREHTRFPRESSYGPGIFREISRLRKREAAARGTFERCPRRPLLHRSAIDGRRQPGDIAAAERRVVRLVLRRLRNRLAFQKGADGAKRGTGELRLPLGLDRELLAAGHVPRQRWMRSAEAEHRVVDFHR